MSEKPKREKTYPTKTKYMHVRWQTPSGVGVTTVAYVELSEHAVEFGVSFCAPNDHFQKSKGRMIAENRRRSLRVGATRTALLRKGEHPQSGIMRLLSDSKWRGHEDESRLPRWIVGAMPLFRFSGLDAYDGQGNLIP